jgi:DNA segregation ATPase FtsK/SpoIIIE, S-DNA-T family
MGARKNTRSNTRSKSKPTAHRRKTVTESKKSPGMSLTMQRRVSEGLLILVGAIALYLLIALVTYHSSDPSWSNSGSQAVANAGGRVGAWLADILLYAFGYPAYVFPILLAVSAWVLFRDKRAAVTQEHELGWGIISLRVIGFALVLLTTCGLCSLLLPHLHAQLPINDAGGIGGSLIAKGIGGVLNKIGGSLVLIALFLIGVTLFSGVSWVALTRLTIQGSGKVLLYTKKAAVWLSAKMLESCRQALAQYKEYRVKRAEEKAAEPVKPRLSFPDTPVRAERPAPIIKPIMTERRSTPSSPPISPPLAKKPLFKGGKRAAVNLTSGELPPLSLLDQPTEKSGIAYSKEKLTAMSESLEKHLAHFNIDARVVGVEPGPVVTRFEVDLAPGVKVSKVSNVDKDLARSMSTSNVRVVEVIPGKSFIGLEIPNEDRAFICLSEILDTDAYRASKSPVTLALGKDISGHPVVTDLAKMPHLLVAGTTGSGKSVSMNTMLLSMLYKSTPKDLRLILIDPKMLELSIYQGIPHLLTPVVTDMKDAANALRWCVVEMDRRYALMAKFGVRNLASLNQKIAEAEQAGEPLKDPLAVAQEGEEAAADLEHLPNVVVLIDELADMMMVVGKKVEELIARIAQKARAAGIHMILATQRPSVDVITGLIKANIPARMAFNVSSRIDSRTILDQQGAQQLLGQGDMLFMPSGSSVLQRVHGPFVSDDEIHRIVATLKKTGQPQYLEEVVQDESSAEGSAGEMGAGAESDELYDQAVQIVTETRRASISLVQRRLRIGYNRAANLLEAMEAAGVVTTMQSNGSREVLAPEPVKD